MQNSSSTGWTKERIRAGFDKFQAENGRLPTASEIDSCSYLPSSRSIQRSFGGLRELRAELGYDDTDFGIGKFRSAIATKVGKSGLEAEVRLEKVLTKLFGQVFVHTQRRYGDGKSRFDFVVYAKNKTFGIDVFSTFTARDLQKNINLKMDRYGTFNYDAMLYFVVSSNTLDKADIARTISNMSKLAKKNNVVVMHEDEFVKELTKYEPVTNIKEVVDFFPYGKDE